MSHLTDTAERHAQQANDTLQLALVNVLGTPEGRELYRWIRDNSRVFVAAPSDGLERWTGWREFGLYLLNTMRRANITACHLAESEGVCDAARRYAALEEARRADEREARENNPFPKNSTTQD